MQRDLVHSLSFILNMKLIILFTCSILVINYVWADLSQDLDKEVDNLHDVVMKLEADQKEVAEIQTAVAFFQDVGQSFQNFGTRIKNFFKIKSDKPTPRPLDHVPAAIQGVIAGKEEHQDPVERVIIESTFIELMHKKKKETKASKNAESDNWLWSLLAKSLE